MIWLGKNSLHLSIAVVAVCLYGCMDDLLNDIMLIIS